MLKLFNTLLRKKEIFRPIKNKKVSLYTCGPTVYDTPHIGNLRCYIFEDVLKRTLIYNGYKVNHIMNITDVGHLTSDADTGEDKIEKSARKKKKSPYEIAEFYTKIFKSNLKDLNIIEPNLWCKATKHIKEQIELIKQLERKGFTYEIGDGIYFDTSKLPDYGKLARLNVKGLKAGARIKMVKDKRNITDFALWKFSPEDKKRLMEWKSPWGIGFPGWHLECAAMSIKYLGIPFDIHCGGVDHISVHHTNEIAEAEGAYERKFVNYWLHCGFLRIEGEKMAKSLGNFTTLEDLKKKRFSPLAFRYLCLQTHYRSSLNFTWKGLESAQNALTKIYESISVYRRLGRETSHQLWERRFKEAFNNDLDTPLSISLIWEMLRSSLKETIKLNLLFKTDKILGLNLKEQWLKTSTVPKVILTLVAQRESYRQAREWEKADEIRKKIKKMGWWLEDTKDEPKIKKLAH